MLKTRNVTIEAGQHNLHYVPDKRSLNRAGEFVEDFWLNLGTVNTLSHLFGTLRHLSILARLRLAKIEPWLDQTLLIRHRSVPEKVRLDTNIIIVIRKNLICIYFQHTFTFATTKLVSTIGIVSW